jgi:hypothetical protein
LLAAAVLCAAATAAQERKVWDQSLPPLSSFQDLDYREYLSQAEASDRTAYRLNDLGMKAYGNDERLERVQEDSDFDSIRGLSEYEYLLMGRNPSIETVVQRRLHVEG